MSDQVQSEEKPLPHDSLVFSTEIIRDNSVSLRGLRNWVASGKFPPPAANLHGRNVWLRETYRQWQAEVLTGKYRQKCNLNGGSVAAA